VHAGFDGCLRAQQHDRRVGVAGQPLDEQLYAGIDDAVNGHRRIAAEHGLRIENRQRVARDQDAARLHLRHAREGAVEDARALGLVRKIVVAATLEWPGVHVRQADVARRSSQTQALLESGANREASKAGIRDYDVRVVAHGRRRIPKTGGRRQKQEARRSSR